MRYFLIFIFCIISISLLSQVVDESNLRLKNTNSNNANIYRHGFLRKLNGDASYFLNGAGVWSVATGTGQPYSDTSTYDATRYWVDMYYVEKSGDSMTGNLRVGNASNHLALDDTSAVRLAGTSTVWDDLMFPFTTGNQGGNSYPVFNSDSGYYTFTPDTTGVSKCKMYFIIQLPHRWKEGSTIYPHVHYKYESSIGSPPKFIMKYKWYSLLGTTKMKWNWYRMEISTGTTDNTHQMMYGNGGISGAGLGISSIIVCEIYIRDVPTNVNAWQFDIHIEIDAMGSNSEGIKD